MVAFLEIWCNMFWFCFERIWCLYCKINFKSNSQSLILNLCTVPFYKKWSIFYSSFKLVLWSFQWHIVVMQPTIQANLCLVTVAVIEPRFCLSSTPVRGKECLWVAASDWGAPVDLFHALSVGQQEGLVHRLRTLSLLPTSTWLENCTQHFLEHWRKVRGEAVRDPHPELVCDGDEAGASF